VALGRAYYLEWLGSPAIIELTALSEGRWVLEGVWGPKNRHPDPEIVWAIRRTLTGYGVLLPIQHVAGKAQMGLAKLLQVYDFSGLDLCELEYSVAAA
jgi:hypothetical protein